jgi:hypothetical protein
MKATGFIHSWTETFEQMDLNKMTWEMHLIICGTDEYRYNCTWNKTVGVELLHRLKP